MIKRIIFDIDKTLLKSDEDVFKVYNEFLKQNDYFNFDSRDLYMVLEKFEATGKSYSNKEVSEFLKNNLDINLNEEHLLEVRKMYGDASTLINKNTDKVLKYLSGKYEIYALSNWFNEDQKNRLRKVDLLKYFKEVYGVDNLGRKPSEEVFRKICIPYELNECIMIGDSIVNDIETPHRIGMNYIYCNYNNVETEYKNIKSLEELLDIL